MIDLDIQVDTKSASAFLREVGLTALPVAEARALNKVIITVRKEAADKVHRVRRMKKGTLKKNMVIVRANKRHLEARIKASNRPVSLKHYSAKLGGRKGHKRVVINVTGEREVLNHAFIIPSKGGHVFERKTSKALPIKRLSGPSIGSALISSTVRLAMNQVIKDKWPTVFTREVQHEINKQAARRAKR